MFEDNRWIDGNIIPEPDDPAIPVYMPIDEQQAGRDYLNFELKIPKECRIEEIKNDPRWYPSYGQDIFKKHYRFNHYHAVCDRKTGWCKIHYDKYDPDESFISLAKHVADSDGGKITLASVIAGAIIAAYLLKK